MIRFITTIIIFFSIGFSLSQKRVISGYIYDKSSNETLIGGSVLSLQSFNGCISNEYGYYSLRLTENDSILRVRSYGYKDTIISIDIRGVDISLNIYLESKVTRFEEVKIVGNKSDIKEDKMGVISIPMEDMRRMPNLFGEVDIIKTYQMTPGVESGGEGSSNYYVRGGGAEQNLMLLDDVPLYNVSHFGGFFSVFNADIIKNSKLIKSGFDAEYSGRLSSVLDVRTKEGNSKKYIVQGGVGLLSTRVAVEGPIKKDKSSFIFSGRINPLPIFKIVGNNLDYRFNDLNAKINLNSSDKNKFFLSFYRGRDRVKIETDNTGATERENNLSWGNTMVSFRWNHKFGSRLFSNLTVYNSVYSYIEVFNFKEKTDSSNRAINNKLTTGVNDIGLKYDYSFFINDKLDLFFGLNSVYHRFRPSDIEYNQSGSNITDLEINNHTTISSLESGAYTQLNLDLNCFSINAGIRYSNYTVDHRSYHNIEPRIISSINFLKSWSFKYSFTVMNQYIHLLTYSGTGLPSDYWMPTTKEVPPSRGVQNSLGLFKSIKNDKYVISLESYYKTADNMIHFKPGATLIGQVEEWHTTIEQNGFNESYGIEFLIQKKLGQLRGWVSATYSRSLLQFNSLNNNETFPFKYDRPLSLNFVAIYKLNDKIDFSATWNYGTGYPITLANEIYSYDGDDIFHFDKINNTRMRDYHRLDVAFNHTKKTNWGERTWTLSVFNLYNRQNAYYYFYEHEVETVADGNGGMWNEKGDLKLYQRSLFSFFPSFSYSFKFN